MKKVWLFIWIVAFVFLGCGQNNQQNNLSEVNLLENASPSIVDFKTGAEFNEICLPISLPKQYFSYTRLCDVDEEWYYLSSEMDAYCWSYIKVNKKDTSQIVELASVDKQIDNSLCFAWNEKLHLVLLYWGENIGECHYEVVELGEDKLVTVLYEGNCFGLPSINFTGQHLILATRQQNGLCSMATYDMETATFETIYECTNEIHEDWSIDGKAICGLEWPRKTPTEEGFCFVVSEMNGRSLDAGQPGSDEVYYYSFSANDITRLTNNGYTVDYVGGTPEFFVVTDYPSVNMEAPSNKLYMKNGNQYAKYNMDDIGISSFYGSCILENNRFLVYSAEGYVVFDLDEMKYCEMNYALAGENSSRKDSLEYQGRFTGFAYDDDAYYFSVIEDEELVIYEIR